ncbi:MAG: hypothetical protein IJA87_02420 [Clostridia bacterium]|nr:hypothetical protein [Clostridia bacterium]
MAKYAVNEEGVAALNLLATRVLECCSAIKENTYHLETVSEDYQGLLGPHYNSLIQALESIKNESEQMKTPVEDISSALTDIADAYEEIIANDRVKAGEKNAQASKGSFISRIFGKSAGSSAGAEGSKFESYDVDEHGFVHGDNYEGYISDWDGYSSENFESEMFGDNAQVSSISPSSIEGIRVSEYDMENPEVFWGQHKKGGTKESFVEIASHIPEVKEALTSGRSLIELENDERLGPCSSIYFDPSRIPQVIECDGYYEFQGNGRHRILAARELGYDIPVKVIGTRKRK